MSGKEDQSGTVLEQAIDEHMQLVKLCDQGMLYEAEEWLHAGHTAARPEGAKKCALRVATDRGFHSLVRLLLNYGCTDDQKLDALENAAEVGDFEICRLLVEAGAPVANLTHDYLDHVVRRDLIEYLLDHGLDLVLDDGLAKLLIYRRVKPLLGLFLQHRKRFPEWEKQAAKALCAFIDKRDLKWISLMIWAKADPWLPVHELSEFSYVVSDDEEDRSSAVERAVQEGDVEIFKMLKVSPTPEQATRLLATAWILPNSEMIKLLLKAGADINAFDPEYGSVLHRLLRSLRWRRSTYNGNEEGRESVEMISWMVRQGAKWILPEEPRGMHYLRRCLYGGDEQMVVEVIRLLEAGKACDAEQLRALVDKPKMKGWVRSCDAELFQKLFPRKKAASRRKAPG